MRNEIKFCDRCGDSLANKTVDGKQRQICNTCGHTIFLDPKLAVVVLVSTEGKLVLVRRAIQPALGRWAFPSGYVDRGETVENAAIREVKEETGLDIKITQLIGVYSSASNPVVLAVYSSEVIGGNLYAGSETDAVGKYDPSRLPDLPFEHDHNILEDWMNNRLHSA
jgi:ADP-ribose pyrophosphatase YjhB (NUDIX family)